MLAVALIEPEIPPNTGNIIRLCANTGASLHLVHPLGFDVSDKRLRRAGLDYHEFARIIEHASWDTFLDAARGHRLIACSTRGDQSHAELAYGADDILVFGSETRGLGTDRLAEPRIGFTVRIPMRPDSRSLNLSNSVAIVLYEAWRQMGFAGS